MPAAIAAQNRRRSSRRATGGRPGDCNLLRPDRSERRFRVSTATSSAKVLRRLFERKQYAADDYRKLLGKARMRQSMSRRGNCYDNAPMKSFFHTLKVELVHQRRWATRNEARRDLFAYLEGYYIRLRLHSALNYRTPEQMERVAA
jgi:putative transposase